jgi:hypothetical protein
VGGGRGTRGIWRECLYISSGKQDGGSASIERAAKWQFINKKEKQKTAENGEKMPKKW